MPNKQNTNNIEYPADMQCSTTEVTVHFKHEGTCYIEDTVCIVCERRCRLRGRCINVTPMTIHTFIKRLDCFTVLLEPTDTTFQKVNCVVRFEVDIAKTYIFFPSDPALELPCCFHVLQVMQRLSPHSLHCPIPSLLVNTTALSKMQLPVILGRLNITWCFCITGPCPRMVFATLSKAGWYTRTKVVHLLLIVFQE